MKQINVMYSQPVMGCLIHIYDEIDIDTALSDSKATCKNLSCTAVVMTVEYSIDKNGEVQ